MANYYDTKINNITVRFPDSFNVKAFPCAYRGTYISEGKEYLFNPESRLNTEYNLTMPTTVGFDTYLNSWNTDVSEPTLHCTIHGYNLEIANVKLTDFDDLRKTGENITKPLYLYLAVKDKTLQDVGAAATDKTTVLCPMSVVNSLTGNVDSEILDIKNGDNYFFIGICFTTEELTLTGTAASAIYKIDLLEAVTAEQTDEHKIPEKSYYMISYKHVAHDSLKGEAGIEVTGENASITIRHANTIAKKETAGFNKHTYDEQGHITGSTVVTKQDVTALGIPGDHSTNTLTVKVNGTEAVVFNQVENKVLNLTAGANVTIAVDTSTNNITITAADTHYPGQILFGDGDPITLPTIFPTIYIDTTKQAAWYCTSAENGWKRLGAFWL